MNALFEHTLTVPEDVIDENDHVNNVAYIAWMQDAATLHSNARGWPSQRYKEIGATWVVRSHLVEYLQPVFAGERLTVQTWVANFRKVRSLRKYRFIRATDNTLVTRAETNWVFVRMDSGRPCAIPAELIDAFETVSPDQEP